MNTLDADHPIVVALTNHMLPCRVVRILSADEFDHDGDPILRLRVVVDETGPVPGDMQLFSATGIVREVMAEYKDDRFPLMTFPTREEMAELAA